MRTRRRRTRPDGKVGVLFVTTPTQPPLGADTWVHMQIVRGLDRSTHDVHVACVKECGGRPTPAYAAIADAPGIRVVPANFGHEQLDRTWRGRLRAIRGAIPIVPGLMRLAVYVRRHRISIIHTTDRPRDALASVALARITRTACIVHVHVVFRDWIQGPLRWSLRRADARIGVSEFVAQSLIDGGHPRDTTFAALNAVDLARWTPEADGGAVRAELGAQESTPVVLCACRLFPEKGARELIAAIGDVRRTIPDVRVWIVGDDASPDGRYLRGCQQLVADLELDDHVVFTGRRTDMVELLAAADVFAMPSFEEPFGLVFAEAMAMRRPVVGLDNGGTREVVEHGTTGLLSPPGDHEMLVKHLVSLLDDPDLRDRLGAAGRRRVECEFTTQQLARNVAHIYEVIA